MQVVLPVEVAAFYWDSPKHLPLVLDRIHSYRVSALNSIVCPQVDFVKCSVLSFLVEACILFTSVLLPVVFPSSPVLKMLDSVGHLFGYFCL